MIGEKKVYSSTTLLESPVKLWYNCFAEGNRFSDIRSKENVI